MPTLEQRIEELNRHFGFREHPEDFNCELNPERIAYKNEALRTKNRDLYASYLADNYPREIDRELADIDSKANSLIQVSKDEAEQLFADNKINMLKSDISYKDPDAIFQMKKVNEEDLNWPPEGRETDLLNRNSRPFEALEGKSNIWLLTYNSPKKTLYQHHFNKICNYSLVAEHTFCYKTNSSLPFILSTLIP